MTSPSMRSVRREITPSRPLTFFSSSSRVRGRSSELISTVQVSLSRVRPSTGMSRVTYTLNLFIFSLLFLPSLTQTQDLLFDELPRLQVVASRNEPREGLVVDALEQGPDA